MRRALARLTDGERAADLACAVRWVQLPMWLLTLMFTALLFQITDVWSGLPLMIAVQAPMLLALASVWPGAGLPRSRAFAATIVAQIVAVYAGGLLAGQDAGTMLPIAVGNLAFALSLGLVYRRRYDTWSPRNARQAVVFFTLALHMSPVGLVFGAYVGCPPSALWSDPTLALIACTRAGVDTCLAIGTAFVLYFAPPAASRLIAKPFAPVIVALTVLAPLMLERAPHSPVAWMVVVGPLCAAATMTPRWTAAVLLTMTGVSAFYTYPWYVPVAVDWFPPKLSIDLLMGFTPLAATVVSVTRDANNRMAAEAASSVRAEQDQGKLLASVFHSMSDGVMLSRDDGRVTMSNHAAERLLGITIPKTIGLGEPATGSEPDAAEPLTPAQVKELLAEPVADDPRDLLIHDGHSAPRRVSVQHRPIRLVDANLTLHVITDITEEYARQRELESFAGTLAHDLKGPLAAVLGWLDAASDELADGDAGSALAASRRAGSASVRMRAMVQDYLAYTVVHDGELQPVNVPLREVAEEIAAVYEGAQRAGIVFEIDVTHEIHADASLTRQVIANLVSNAVKYSRPAEAGVVCITSADDAPGWVRIAVADRGLGIQPGDEEAIFEAYQRSDKDAASHQGIGLGLSLCAQVVRRHGGWIRAQTNDWGGATVSFTMPARGPALPA